MLVTVSDVTAGVMCRVFIDNGSDNVFLDFCALSEVVITFDATGETVLDFTDENSVLWD